MSKNNNGHISTIYRQNSNQWNLSLQEQTNFSLENLASVFSNDCDANSIDYLNRGKTITEDYYSALLDKVSEKCCRIHAKSCAKCSLLMVVM